MISKVGPATGVEGSILERRKLFGEREYRVTLLEPPSFTRTPQSREFALTQGDPFSLVYEVEGSVPFRYRWYFRAAGADSPPRALAAGDGIAIDLGVGRSALKIAGLREQDEGEYFLVAENAAGREPAPGVSVEVFQPPELLSFLARDGEEKPRRIEAGGMEGGLAPLWVNEGEGLVLEAEVAGSGPISGIWKRLDDDTAPSRPVSEDPVPQDAVATLHLESATSEDAGQYQLTLESPWGKLVGPTVEVAVRLPPRARLTVEGQRDKVRQGDDLTLKVEVTAGTPPFSYQWYRDGDEVPVEQGGESEAVTVSTDHGGFLVYEAQVRNPAGEYQPPPHEITVLWREGSVFQDCKKCPEMVVVPSGLFQMGSSLRPEERPVHPVSFSKPIAVGRYEITQMEFGQFVAETGYSSNSGCYTLKLKHDFGVDYDFDEKSRTRVTTKSGVELFDKFWDAYDYMAEHLQRTLEELVESSSFGWQDPGYEQGPREPVACVSWKDAKAYVAWLSQHAKQEYRLMSESEWEYATRGDTITSRYWGNDDAHACSYANVGDSSLKSAPHSLVGGVPLPVEYDSLPKAIRLLVRLPGSGLEGIHSQLTDKLFLMHFLGSPSSDIEDTMREFLASEGTDHVDMSDFYLHYCRDGFLYTSPVGKFKPNAFGLYDMAGNVWEWVDDCWHENYEKAPADGQPWHSAQGGDCGRRVMRGGSWYDVPFTIRSSYRMSMDPAKRESNVGFRVARSLD